MERRITSIWGSQLFFLGESKSVDGLDPKDSANNHEKHCRVYEDRVDHAPPLVHPQTVIQVEHLLLLLHHLVS